MFIINHVATSFVMIARRATQVVLDARSQEAQQSKRTKLLQPTGGTDFMGGLWRQTPSEGNHHSRRRFSNNPSHKVNVVAMRNIIRGS